MKILHTADWHLGSDFFRENRDAEFEKTLNFLVDTIRANNIQCVLIAGDIFNSPHPSNKASELYYNFLLNASRAGVKKIIVTAGNHDSPHYMDAPRELLNVMNIHVFSSFQKENPEKHLLELKEEDGSTAAVVLALPFLRENDLREPREGEENNARTESIIQRTEELYLQMTELARQKFPGIPLIATGHFWAVGPQDYFFYDHVGNAPPIPVGKIAEKVDYLALGHIHTQYEIQSIPNARYSGSLLCTGFNEAQNLKKITILDSSHLEQEPQMLDIPSFQNIKTITADTWDILAGQLEELKSSPESIWLQVNYEGPFIADLDAEIRKQLNKTKVILLQTRSKECNPDIHISATPGKKLSEMTPHEVFERILQQQKNIDDETKRKMQEALQDVINDLEGNL